MVPIRRAHHLFITSVATLMLSTLAVIPAAARQIVVGTGTAESCFEATLQLALARAADEGGGRIRFNCGEAPVTISIARLLPGEARPARLVLPDNTTIDGDDLITLDGGWQDGVLILVPADSTAELRSVTVRSGSIFSPAIFNLGTLEIERCTVSDSLGGGVWTGGDLRVRHSLFKRNTTFVGNGGIFNSVGGTLVVDHTSFIENRSDGGGGGVDNRGTATVRHSVFTGNSAHGLLGGAFLNGRNAEATIQNSEFSGNDGGFDGGALANEGTLTIRNSSIKGNTTFRYGGGIYAGEGSVTTLSNTIVTGNRAGLGAGGIYLAPGSSLRTRGRTSITGNLPDDIAP
jgi:hypothetical protein